HHLRLDTAVAAGIGVAVVGGDEDRVPLEVEGGDDLAEVAVGLGGGVAIGPRGGAVRVPRLVGGVVYDDEEIHAAGDRRPRGRQGGPGPWGEDRLVGVGEQLRHRVRQLAHVG